MVALTQGCGGGDDGTIRVGYFPNITHGPAILAKEEGILARALDGENVEWVRFLSGPEAITAVLAGSVDATYTGPGPVITAASRAPGEIVVLAGAAQAGAVLVARKESDIRSPADLDGARIGVPTFGGTQDLALRDVLRSAGLRAETQGGTARIVPIENQELQAALENDVIDAAMAPEPWGSRLLDAGVARLVLDADDIMGGDYPTTVLAAAADLERERPDIIDKLVSANAEAVALAEKDPALVARRFNDIVVAGGGTALKDDILRAATQRTRPSTTIGPASMARLIAEADDAGYLRAPVAVEDVVPR